MYLNILTYISQQMQLMYTKTLCFGENKWIQKIFRNTQKYNLRRATIVMISNFRGRRRKKKTRFAQFFWRESRKKMMRTFNYFLQGTLGGRKAFVKDKGIAHTHKIRGEKCQQTEISNLKKVQSHRPARLLRTK